MSSMRTPQVIGSPLVKSDLAKVAEKRLEEKKKEKKEKERQFEEWKQEQIKIHDKSVAETRLAQLKSGQSGKLALVKMRMRTYTELMPNFQHVYPNNWHSGRVDGWGMPTLSPMRLGPIDHKMPGLPPALNLENYWQGSKCFRDEVDRFGMPLPQFVATQKQWFEDPEPHRHKQKGAPEFFVYWKKDGSPLRLKWVESRQIYCHWYAKLVRQQRDYSVLVERLKQGYNLAICGYDANPMGATEAEIDRAYCSTDAPFGHERVLFTMLLLPPEKWPWVKFATLEL